MSYTLNDLEKHFRVSKEEGALLFVYLTLLPPGESVDFLNGRIEKLTEDTLRLCVDQAIYHQVADGFLIEKIDDYDEMFPNQQAPRHQSAE